MGLTYAESLALRLPVMTEQEREATLWRLQKGELSNLARRLGIPRVAGKTAQITRISQAVRRQAAQGVQQAFV